jgi:hypothetical protein
MPAGSSSVAGGGGAPASSGPITSVTRSRSFKPSWNQTRKKIVAVAVAWKDSEPCPALTCRNARAAPVISLIDGHPDVDHGQRRRHERVLEELLADAVAADLLHDLEEQLRQQADRRAVGDHEVFGHGVLQQRDVRRVVAGRRLALERRGVHRRPVAAARAHELAARGDQRRLPLLVQQLQNAVRDGALLADVAIAAGDELARIASSMSASISSP